MARPRTFDEGIALDTAMRLFWRKGYEATSTRDLCETLGLDRSSVYNAFNSKHELFKRALTHYIETTTAAATEILDDHTRSPADRIRALFGRIIADEWANRHEDRNQGCLTVNTTVELAGRDPEIAALLDRDLRHRLSALQVVIGAGRAAGDITSRRDPADLARYVNSVIAGIRVAARGGAGRADLEAVAETAMDALTR
ncbi:TetR/AcrR family transcriptional regulator [Sinosporangium siamense]|uniref:TetR family transcriptional regulator n=1 Tax=Sinosporangium siamense TaxID=1367973 RepID=A0A919RN34_9ACTN|nr:TetR/AcrR family transcriptional regulator [Sinosporangium siamense]GII95885.1 TetR family transcriptional regulator [Sinosporangium siamense]